MSYVQRGPAISGPGSGTVTSITAGTGLTGTPNPITTTGTIALTIPVTVPDGGTDNISFTAYAPILGGTTTTGALQQATTGFSNSGYVLTSTGSSSLPTFAAVPASITWHDVTAGSATLAAANGYIADSSTLTTFTMPANNAFGDTIYIVGKGTGLWKTVYTTGQNIVFGSSTSTTTTGNISSTNAGDCITMVCTTASATAPIFTVISSIGSPSIT